MKATYLALSILTATVYAQDAERAAFAIVQGASGNGTAQFGVQVKRGAAVNFAVKPGDGASVRRPTMEERISSAGSEWEQVRLTFAQLSNGVDHELMVIRDKKIADTRKFRIPDWNRKKGRIAIVSCLDDSFREQAQMWSELLAHEPDAIMIIGDAAYCDVAGGRLVRDPTPPLLWSRHATTRALLDLYRAPRLRPVFTTWDDHDFGKNNAGREFEHKRASAKMFRAFFPQQPIDGFLECGPGVSARFKLFGQTWMMLDGRTFRSPNRKAVPDETMFGALQEAWIRQQLARPEPLWIVNGAQMFNGYHRFEAYESCQPKSFQAFVQMIRDGRAPVAFVSGDRHLAEVSAIDKKECGFATAEITTSALHARTFPNAWAKEPNPRKVAGVSGALNYAILDVEATDHLSASLTVHGIDKKKFFEYAVSVKRGDG
ncbi:MAG: alkaline phosphatase D family protein [Planctomycetota bacterium]|jgi:alkaline phosphatase D